MAMQKVKWSTIILDEAQAIKNPSTAQTKAIKAQEGLRHKLALNWNSSGKPSRRFVVHF